MDDRTSLFETTRCACLASRRAARRITRRFDQALRAHGLRATQFTILAALRLAGPQSVGALADLLDIERTTMSRNLAVAAQRDLLTLRADPEDARSRIATLTAHGRHTLETALPTWQAVQKSLVEELGETTVHNLHQLAGGPCIAPLPNSSYEPQNQESPA
ncbi:MarR family transcriptional regulator [Oleiagrimonas citrea]|jgi:DNA-binding MarR family transcriptional regulator|uniref:Winged helix-turn-helix transcriptional regulator n=1 Tax=Oleiagrimonas citrea TaxID=1665687 RepID=A0A846ZNJ2_9GAMM|nr:MarR family winged helix-turn-helix transcriptional regulator [Oleiagrimonas citrea]NKZ39110.1 winged helix-turn-helix transcriptional regulator [Oleiagrimonas citrea]